MKPIKHCWCGSIAEGNTDQCATHNSEDRKNERYAAKQKVVRQVQKVTPKRAQQNQEYMKLRAQYLEVNKYCEVAECDLKATEIHHISGRDGEKLTDINNFMAVCHKHHHDITVNSKKAIDDGYSKSRTSNQEQV